ncbi:hypothetical protein [Winogradskyella aurantiaca]|uniref:hypothetical protein n=1 Tax=Winogradskyella aurantiaca TaxID=2219558 RepID=UPI000E1C65A5|nr:hypothetical protein [Winogradskyella aurantiaca]
MDIVRGSYEKDSITIEFYRHTNPIYKSSKVYCIDVSFVEGQDHQVIKMYSRVYRTKNKNWAVPYSRYWHRLSSDLKNRSITIKPENVNFVSYKSYPMQVQRKIFDNPRYYNYSIISDFDYYIQYQFPNPYFKHTKDSILTIYGYYAEDFARLSKQRETYFIINRKETDSLFNQQKARPPTKPLSVSEEQRFYFEQGTRELKKGYKGWAYSSFNGTAKKDPDSPLGKLAQFKADSIINTNRSRLIDSMQGDWQLSEQHLVKNFKSDFMMNVNRIQIEGERMTFMSRLPNNSGIELPIKTEPIKFNDFFIETYDLNEILLPDGSLWLVYASKKTLHFVYSGQVFNEHKRSQYIQSQGAFFSYKFIKETKK